MYTCRNLRKCRVLDSDMVNQGGGADKVRVNTALDRLIILQSSNLDNVFNKRNNKILLDRRLVCVSV